MFYLDQFELYTVVIITLLAVISPGPDFALVSKISLIKGRKEGVLCALGIALAISVHLAYTLVGLGLVFANNVWVLNSLRYLGAIYLIWLGISALWPDIKKWLLRTSSKQSDIAQKTNSLVVNQTSSFWLGFSCNALNPKTMLFIVSLFSQVISDTAPIIVELAYGTFIACAHFIWFSLVACLLTAARVQDKVIMFKAWIERFTGVFLAVFGIRLLSE